MKKNQFGFSVLEIILIIVLIGVLGGAGWLVLKRNNSADRDKQSTALVQPNTNSEKEATPPPKAANDESDNWLLYTSADDSYRIRLVDGQEFLENRTDNGASGLSAADFMPKPGTQAVVGPLESGKEGVMGLFIGPSDLTVLEHTRGEKQAGFKTTSGQDVEEYDFVQTTDPDLVDIAKGGKENTYFVRKGDKTIRIIYSYFDNENTATNLDYVKKMIKSAEIL